MTALDIHVRPMHADEFAATRALAVSAFGDDESIGLLLDALRYSWAWVDGLSFVAVRGDELVGQVLYTRALLDAPTHLVDVLVLSPVGVRPDLQRGGIGQAMIRHTLGLLASTRVEPMVFLEGSPVYYPKVGFEDARAIGFRHPSRRVPPGAFQVFRLPSYEPSMSGSLVYPDAFWRTDSVGLR